MIGDAVSVGNVYIYVCVCTKIAKIRPGDRVPNWKKTRKHCADRRRIDTSRGDEMSADRAEIARKAHGYEPAARRTRTELKTEMADTRWYSFPAARRAPRFPHSVRLPTSFPHHGAHRSRYHADTKRRGVTTLIINRITLIYDGSSSLTLWILLQNSLRNFICVKWNYYHLILTGWRPIEIWFIKDVYVERERKVMLHYIVIKHIDHRIEVYVKLITDTRQIYVNNITFQLCKTMSWIFLTL